MPQAVSTAIIRVDGNATVVEQGSEWPADHPIVTKHAWLFDTEQAVETATAKPGEKRKRPAKKPAK